MDKEVKHQGQFPSRDLAKKKKKQIWKMLNTDRSLMLMQMLERMLGSYVALCKYVIQVVYIHQPLRLCFHSSPASWVCLPSSPSLSSLDPFIPMSPFHTSFRHSERDGHKAWKQWLDVCVSAWFSRWVFTTLVRVSEDMGCTEEFFKFFILMMKVPVLHNLFMLF